MDLKEIRLVIGQISVAHRDLCSVELFSDGSGSLLDVLNTRLVDWNNDEEMEEALLKFLKECRWPIVKTERYASHLSTKKQIDVEEEIASMIFDTDENFVLTESVVAELSRNILKSVLAEFRPDLFTSEEK